MQILVIAVSSAVLFMMSAVGLLTIYSLLILLASLFGGWIALSIKLTHGRMQIALSLVSGFMLGIGLLHLLPHAAEELGSVKLAMQWLMLGLLTMFFTERFFCYHHHEVPDQSSGKQEQEHDHHVHDEHKLTWTGVGIGLSIHSLIAGTALAANVEVEIQTGKEHGIAGLAVFLLIFLHKPFDSLTLGTLMAAGKWSRGWRHGINVLFSLAIPIGVLIFYLFWKQEIEGHRFMGCALAFSAGAFLCISLSDLLPELQFHCHDRAKLSIALLTGLALAWIISHYEEQIHEHEHHDHHEHHEHNHHHEHSQIRYNKSDFMMRES